MSVVKAPLDPREIAEIEGLVSDIENPVQREQVRAHLMGDAQARADRGTENRKRYREGLAQARANAHPDPVGFALQHALDLRIIDMQNERFLALLKRVEARNRKRWDKFAHQQEALSKSAARTPRRLPQRDRDYVDLIGEADEGGWLGDLPLVLSKLKEKLGTYRLPHWEKTTISLKIMAMSVVSAKEGAQTINLRLSPTYCAKALNSNRGAVSYMQNRVRQALERAFGKRNCPDFWFTIETDRSDLFHLHGAVVTPTTPNARDLVDQALREAGGGWDSPKGKQYQQVSNDLAHPIGWASYVVKHMNVSKQDVSGKLFASTAGIRAAAAGSWEQLRASMPQLPPR